MASDEAVENQRKHIEKLETELTTRDTKIKDLSTENKTLRAERVFQDAGYSPKQAALYVEKLAEDAEITADSVKEFASKYDISPVVVEGSGAGEGDTSKKDEGLASMGAAGTREGAGGGAAAGASITRAEYLDLVRKDPSAAREALGKGRVQLRDDNFYVQKGVVSSG